MKHRAGGLSGGVRGGPCGRLIEDTLDRAWADRLAEQEALDVRAADRCEAVALVLGLDPLIASIGEVDTLVATIAASSEQQASGLQQVNTAVAEMDGVTQQNAAMVEEATAAARSLAAEADELARHIARFSLGDDQRAAPANNVHELQARVSTAAKRTPRSTRGSAAAAVATDDWSQF